MKKLLLIFCILFSSFLILTPVFAEDVSSVYGKKVIIDAGHGGSDPGSTACAGLYEKDANLEITYKLKELLEDAGATVYLTRIDDSTLSNEDRYDYANSTDGEVLVSIHLNGAEDNRNGTLGLYAKIKKDKAFTETMHSNMAESLGVPDLGVTNFMSGVTLRFKGPATIQEAVYISNDAECAQLKDGTGVRQLQIAQALLEGLENWFEEPTSWSPPGKSRNIK